MRLSFIKEVFKILGLCENTVRLPLVIVNEDLSNRIKDFVNKFLIEQFMIKMEAVSLYHLHLEISKIITQKITLKFFVTLFKDKKNNIYGYNSVKLGVNYENHKLAQKFKDIFERFPK